MVPQLQWPPILVLLLIPFIFFIAPSSAGASSPPGALVAPISKDTLTSLYSISLNNRSPFVLDLTSPFSWSTCPPAHPVILCNSTTCSVANSFQTPYCPRITRVRRTPCTCTVSLVNPVTKTCGFGDLTLTNITVSTTNGRNPTTPITIHSIVSSCASRSLLAHLPRGSVGVAGLAWSSLALSSQLLTQLITLKPQFAICLPSTSKAPGVAFFGNKPYYLLPPTLLEVTTILSYTPLLKNPLNPQDYHIDLKGMAVNGKAVQFLARILEFDSLGHGGVILSTTTPYTTLRSHVYRPFLQTFAKATKGIRRAPKMKPFDLCLNTTGLGSTRVGYPVPQIDLILAGGKNWTIFGANSLKQVGPETACLAFVDGGPKAQHAMAIGGFQMEDNFLLFDLAKSRLGFSSSLFFFRTTCGNFNFTTGS